jgi:P4 family phage/plasmid primase-like protien
MDDQHQKQLIDDLRRIHIPLGRQIFPLAPRSKTPPRGVQWRLRRFSEAELIGYINREYNLAWALGHQDCVIDIDPRHAKAVESFDKMLSTVGIASEGLSNQTVVVQSGGNDRGHHYYLRLPPDVKIKTNLSEYPGILFKKFGGYVVLPGSLHPSGRYYDWDYFSPYEKLPTLIPPKLLSLLSINSIPPAINILKKDTQEISVAELQHYLGQLDPKNFQSRQAWIELAFMVHSANKTYGREAFMAWSATDNLYENCEEENEKIWESIKDDKLNSLGFGSLVRMVIDKGGTPYRVPAKIEFDDGINPEKSRYDEFIEKISKMPTSQDDYTTKKIIKEAYTFGHTRWTQTLKKEVAKCLDVNPLLVDKFWKQIDRAKIKEQKEQKLKKIDYPEKIAEEILKEKFDNGRHLVHAINQQFYSYKKTHWETLKDNVVTKLIYESALALKLKHKANYEAASKVKSAHTALIAKTTKPHNDVFNFAGRIKPIINCANGEIHIDVNRGVYEFRKHSPESYLLYCLSVSYDPNVKCPIWDNTIKGIFNKCKDPENVIRHLYEMFGYVIQPQKNIPSWFLWLGGGNNGKSMVIKILETLVGSHAILPKSIQELANTGQSNHAIASLVGKLITVDDDADIEKTLPSSTLKKLAESQLWESNPKHKDTFNFRSSVTPIVLFNGWPRIRDITQGMLRKIFVFPFNRQFVTGVDEDKTLRSKIEKTELSGLLNHALRGLKRLRLRGHFDPPIDCIEAKNEWLQRSNVFLDWLHTRCTLKKDSWTSVEKLYDSYLTWANQNQLTYTGGRTRLENHLFQRGLRLKSRDEDRGFLGIEIKK